MLLRRCSCDRLVFAAILAPLLQLFTIIDERVCLFYAFLRASSAAAAIFLSGQREIVESCLDAETSACVLPYVLCSTKGRWGLVIGNTLGLG